MACTIKIRKALTSKVEELSDKGLNMTLEAANEVASNINEMFKEKVVEFTKDELDYDDMIKQMIDNKEITFTNEDNELCNADIAKPSYKSSFASSKTLVGSKNPVQNKIIQDGFKSKLKQLNDISKKIWKI